MSLFFGDEQIPHSFLMLLYIYEPQHVISNNVVFWQVQAQMSLCSHLLSLETPNDVQSVA